MCAERTGTRLRELVVWQGSYTHTEYRPACVPRAKRWYVRAARVRTVASARRDARLSETREHSARVCVLPVAARVRATARGGELPRLAVRKRC